MRPFSGGGCESNGELFAPKFVRNPNEKIIFPVLSVLEELFGVYILEIKFEYYEYCDAGVGFGEM